MELLFIHKTDNAVVVNNTIFANGISPLTSNLAVTSQFGIKMSHKEDKDGPE